ncbi:MAG: PorV/PorQ family protein [Spirochaetes bacterium]|nr:PorV/PorQ family protein [Spirochaetota bacterium]
MHLKKNIQIILIIIWGFSQSLLFSATGESGIASLMLDSYGGRPMALGDAYTGIADDINSITVNPAGLNTLRSTEVSLLFLKYPLDILFANVAAGTGLSESVLGGYIAGGLTVFYLPEFERYDALGNQMNEKLSASDFVITLGYANSPLKLFGIDQNFSIGFNIKFIQSRLVEVNKNAFCFDIGALYKTDFVHLGSKGLRDNLGIGLSMQNLGSPIIYGTEETLLPRNLRIGIGYKFLQTKDHSFLTGIEINFPNDSSEIASVALEYGFIRTFFLRAGYKPVGKETEKLSCGAGIQYKVSAMTMRLNYALIPMEEIGIKHIISLDLKFDTKRKISGVFTRQESGEELIINIGEYENKLFSSDRRRIGDSGHEILGEVSDVIIEEEYKRVIINVYKTELDKENRTLSRQQAEALLDFFIDQGIERSRITYKVYNTEKSVKTGSGRIEPIKYEIVIVRWKEREEEKFKEHYFNGLDAYIKERYQKAIDEWNKALKMDPKNEDLKRRIREAEEKL